MNTTGLRYLGTIGVQEYVKYLTGYGTSLLVGFKGYGRQSHIRTEVTKRWRASWAKLDQ